jgi:hypothetical protein
MAWKQLLASITSSVDEERCLRNAYLSSADAWNMTTVRPHDHVALVRRLMSDYAVTLPVPEDISARPSNTA